MGSPPFDDCNLADGGLTTCERMFLQKTSTDLQAA